jgi:GNAT superfamily N-acetyltransferase
VTSDEVAIRAAGARDLAAVEDALSHAASHTVGAAWLRFLPSDDAGYGFVADGVPELGIGVHPAYRGRGVGRRLLRALLAAAREQGIARISLSVERANPARRLYLDEGFRVVGGDADADTMVVDLPTVPAPSQIA